MSNKKLIEGVKLLKRDVLRLEERLRKTSNNQFEPNRTEKMKIARGVRSIRKRLSNLIFMI